MKILQLIKGLGLGGAERHVVDLSLGLMEKGYDVQVAYLLPNKDAMVKEIEEAGIGVHCLGGRSRLGVEGLFLLWRLLHEFRPDVVHAHLPVPALLARILKLRFGFKLVTTEHNLFPRYHWAVRCVHRITRRLDDVVISCSGEVSKALPWSSIVVENGLSTMALPVGQIPSALRRSASVPASAVVFICIANLLMKKNHALLVSAFAQAVRLAPDVMANARLVLVGQDGTERRSLERRVKDLSLDGLVHFFGPHPRAADLLREADVFCLSSSFEGLPIALLEAMCNGLPAVVTAVGGMPAAVVDGVSGYVVQKGDEGSFARALVLLAADSNLRTRMGVAARERVRERYSLEAMVESIAGLYASDGG